MQARKLILQIGGLAILGLCAILALLELPNIALIQASPSLDPFWALFYCILLILWLILFGTSRVFSSAPWPETLLRSLLVAVTSLFIAALAVLICISIETSIAANTLLSPSFLFHSWAYNFGALGSLILAKGYAVRIVVFIASYTICGFLGSKVAFKKRDTSGTVAKLAPLIATFVSSWIVVALLSITLAA